MALSSTLALPFLNRPIHSPCHNLCTHTPPPKNYASLLNLGLSYCLRAPRTLNQQQFSTIFDRFRRDLYIKSHFIGDPSDVTNWDPKKLYIASPDWEPDSAVIKDELKAISGDFLRKLKTLFLPNHTRQSSSINLDRVQRRTLDTLEKSSSHVIIPTDKNLGPAVLERTSYINTVLSLLHDTRTYQRLTPEEADLAMNTLAHTLDSFITKHSLALDDDETTYLNRSINASTDYYSHFYIIAKIHKNPWKPRPIVSYCGSLLYGLGKWLDSQLQPIARATEAYISSSFDLCDQIKKIWINPSRDSLFTADATAMYTNIDTSHALQVFAIFFRTHDLCRPIRGRVDMILEALDLLMRNNLFQFGDTYWSQIDGTAMGAPPAPAYATIYFTIHELELLSQFRPFLKFYKRYIDDAFAIWHSSLDPLEDAHHWSLFKTAAMNFGHLTWKVEDRTPVVHFLDLTISIEN